MNQYNIFYIEIDDINKNIYSCDIKKFKFGISSKIKEELIKPKKRQSPNLFFPIIFYIKKDASCDNSDINILIEKYFKNKWKKYIIPHRDSNRLSEWVNLYNFADYINFDKFLKEYIFNDIIEKYGEFIDYIELYETILYKTCDMYDKITFSFIKYSYTKNNKNNIIHTIPYYFEYSYHKSKNNSIVPMEIEIDTN